MKKGIFIDVENRQVSEVEIQDGLQPIYDKVGCELFEIVEYDYFNDVYVDEEGLLKLTPESKFFTIEGYPTPLVGNGLIMGVDKDSGESVDTNLSVEEVSKRISFQTLNEVRELVRV